jgi:hypothetical protein
MIDQLKSLGIEKGKPFSPDAHRTELLNQGIKEAKRILEGMYEKGWETFWGGSRWRAAAPAEVVKAQSGAYSDPDSYPVDDRAMIYTYGYVGIKRLGVGQFYLISIYDKAGAPFEGSRTYRLTVPANVPIDQYWSVTAYDRQTHALIRNMARASRSSQVPELQKNADGSVDVYFGPKAPPGRANNWVPTDPAREFELMFRLYGPKKTFFDKVWTLPDAQTVAVP